MLTELFYSLILNMNRGFLHTRSFRHIQLLVFRHSSIKDGFVSPKSFQGLQEMDLGPLIES